MIEDTLHELTKAMNALEATVARIGDALVANGLKMVFEDRTTPPPKAEPKPSKEPVAEDPTPVPEKRGPGRPKNPPKVEPAPEPVVEAALEPPAEVDETQVSSISYTVDDLRTRLIKIATLVNEKAGKKDGDPGAPGRPAAAAHLRRISGFGKLPEVPEADYATVVAALDEVLAAMSDEEDFT